MLAAFWLVETFFGCRCLGLRALPDRPRALMSELGIANSELRRCWEVGWSLLESEPSWLGAANLASAR